MSGEIIKRGRPATGQTPLRSIRVSDATWARWRKAALAAGKPSITAWIHSIAEKNDTMSCLCIDENSADA